MRRRWLFRPFFRLFYFNLDHLRPTLERRQKKNAHPDKGGSWGFFLQKRMTNDKPIPGGGLMTPSSFRNSFPRAFYSSRRDVLPFNFSGLSKTALYQNGRWYALVMITSTRKGKKNACYDANGYQQTTSSVNPQK